ncbi:MAG: leucine-rich repeat domain-containing protein, partial [Bacteroidota bacterium]
ESLFVNANALENLKALHYLPQLQHLYCNDNQLTDLWPLAQSTNLETLCCNQNPITSFAGISELHAAKLKTFIGLPNDAIEEREIKRLKKLGIIVKKG